MKIESIDLDFMDTRAGHSLVLAARRGRGFRRPRGDRSDELPRPALRRPEYSRAGIVTTTTFRLHGEGRS